MKSCCNKMRFRFRKKKDQIPSSNGDGNGDGNNGNGIVKEVSVPQENVQVFATPFSYDDHEVVLKGSHDESQTTGTTNVPSTPIPDHDVLTVSSHHSSSTRPSSQGSGGVRRKNMNSTSSR